MDKESLKRILSTARDLAGTDAYFGDTMESKICAKLFNYLLKAIEKN